MFVLVRHALAGKKSTWSAPDDQRPLTPAGRSQAVGLAEWLGDLGLTALLSSPSERCRQTLAPLAARLQLPVLDAPALSTDAADADLFALLASDDAAGAALCTHGEVISRLLGRWHEQSGSSTPLLAEREPGKGIEKGAALIVTARPGGPPLLRYVPPHIHPDGAPARPVRSGPIRHGRLGRSFPMI
jgi:phosphohistidine phosphatase SixA